LNESKNGGEQWEVVSLPAIAQAGNADALVRDEPKGRKSPASKRLFSNAPAFVADEGIRVPNDPLGREPGDALCPDRYDIPALRRIEKKLGSYSFAALYQQNPVPIDGGIFKRTWFTRIVDNAPDDLKWFRGYDLAVSTRTTADHTASVRCGMDTQGNIYIADGFRSRIEYPEQRRFVIERMQDERDTAHGVESALHGQALVQDILREAKLFHVVPRAIRTDTDKVTRALIWAAKAEAGKVILVRGPWIEDFIEEICTFPNGAHDDQVDATSLAFRMMTERKKVSAGF